MDRRANVGVALLAVGVLLVANPLYLGHLLPYPTPGDGFRFTGVYHAQLCVLGLVAALSGAYVLLRSRPMTPRIAGLVAFAAVVGHVAVNRLVARVSLGALGRDAHDAFGGALVNPLAYPGGEGPFVEFALASLFAVGVVARGGSPREHATVLLAAGAVVAYMAVAGSAMAGLGGLLLSGLSADLLGIPLAGLVLSVLPLVLGLGFDRLVDDRGGRKSTR